MNGDLKNTIGAARVCLRLLRYVFYRWKGLFVVLTTMILKNGTQVVKPLPMMILVDHVLSQKPFDSTIGYFVEILPGTNTQEGILAWVAGSTVLIFFLEWALDLGSAYAKIGFGQQMVYDLATDLYRHLQRLSIKYHARKSIGDLICRVTTDTASISTIVNGALLPVPASIFTLVSMFAIMWQLDRTLAFLALLVIPFMIIIVRLYSSPMNMLSYKQNEAEGEIFSVVEENLSAIPVIQAFSREQMNDSRLRRITDKALKATIDSNKIQLRFKVLTGLATAVGTAGIIWIGGSHVLNGKLSVGSMLVFISYLASLYGPLESLMYTSMTINHAAGSARRVIEVLDTDKEVEDRPGAKTLEQVRGHLRFENVSFGYEVGRPTINNVSFEILSGQKIAIVGPTGAGKSTLLSLIPRFFDVWEGKVLIDDVDVRDVKLDSLRRQVGLVLQEPFLFPVTVAENISYGRSGATREEIESAARAANADEFIRSLPEGYETIVGERGATLSGGERQRISIARAVLKDAPILILDEPTSALDVETEKTVLEALERLMQGRTTLIIAHRLTTVRKADRIVVIKNGMIAEQGSHSQLMIKNGIYSSLYKTQLDSITNSKGQESPLMIIK